MKKRRYLMRLERLSLYEYKQKDRYKLKDRKIKSKIKTRLIKTRYKTIQKQRNEQSN